MSPTKATHASDTRPDEMPPSKPSETESQKSYTPDQAVTILRHALSSPLPQPPHIDSPYPSPLLSPNSPLFHKRPHAAGRGTPLRSEIHGSDMSSSPYPSPSSTYQPIGPAVRNSQGTPIASLFGRPTPYANKKEDLRQSNFDWQNSPIRPSPSPTRGGADSQPLPGQSQMFEVEAEFLKGLLWCVERQNKIVPDYMLTKSEVREIVREELELEKQRESSKEEEEDVERRKEAAKDVPLHRNITPLTILGLGVGVAGAVLMRRVCMRFPGVVNYITEGVCRGGMFGVVGALAMKGTLWALEKFKKVRALPHSL